VQKQRFFTTLYVPELLNHKVDQFNSHIPDNVIAYQRNVGIFSTFKDLYSTNPWYV